MKTHAARTTSETRIEVEFGSPSPSVETPNPFLSHMLASLDRHGDLELRVKAASLDGDPHHLIEDVALTLGEALRRATEGKSIVRFAHEVIPMDDALVGCYLDAGGRPYYEGALPEVAFEHFLRSLALEAKFTLHVNVMRGRDVHHITEAAFKGLGRCLKQALHRSATIASTKGRVGTRGR